MCAQWQLTTKFRTEHILKILGTCIVHYSLNARQKQRLDSNIIYYSHLLATMVAHLGHYYMTSIFHQSSTSIGLPLPSVFQFHRSSTFTELPLPRRMLLTAMYITHSHTRNHTHKHAHLHTSLVYDNVQLNPEKLQSPVNQPLLLVRLALYWLLTTPSCNIS